MMKVILKAFDGLLESKVKEWPEMPLGQDVEFPLSQLDWSLHSVDRPEARKVIDLRATFRSNGYHQVEKGGALIHEYELISVSPEHWQKK